MVRPPGDAPAGCAERYPTEKLMIYWLHGDGERLVVVGLGDRRQAARDARPARPLVLAGEHVAVRGAGEHRGAARPARQAPGLEVRAQAVDHSPAGDLPGLAAVAAAEHRRVRAVGLAPVRRRAPAARREHDALVAGRD